MKGSSFTKSCRRKLWLFRILDWICLAAPLIIYVIVALANGDIAVGYKVAVVSTTMIAIILTVFNVLAQKKLRCPIWILLIGLYVAMRDYLMPLIIILAITSILDDLVFTPIIGYYRSKLISNKAIDERFPDEKPEEAETQE